MKNKTEWFLIADGMYTHITNDIGQVEKLDSIYDSYSEAKKALIKYHESRMLDFKEALKAARSLKKKDFV